MDNTSNKIYVLARVDDAGVRQVLTACTDKQEAVAVLDKYVDLYRQHGFKKSGHYTEQSNIPGYLAIVRLLPPLAEERAEKGKDYSTYILEVYEIEPTHPGDELPNINTGTIWDLLPRADKFPWEK